MNTTPEQRAAQMDAMPYHVIYLSRGGPHWGTRIVQTHCDIVSDTPAGLTVREIWGDLTIPQGDVLAVVQGRFTKTEMDAVFAEHGDKQSHWRQSN